MLKNRILTIISIVCTIIFIVGSSYILYFRNSSEKSETRLVAIQTLQNITSRITASFDNPVLAPIPDNQIKLLFLGDIMLGRYVRTLMEKNHDLNYAFAKAHPTTGPGANFLTSAFDRVIANLEGPIIPIPNRSQTGMSFGFAPDTAKIVKDNGINIVTIANNHTLDQRKEGLISTKKYLTEAGLPFFGDPILPTEADTHYETIKGKKFAFIGFHDATHHLDDAAAAKLIQKIAPTVDYTIVAIHWGIEYQTKPSSRQQQLAHLFVDSGASLIIGHHPHVPQTIETYKNAPIVYSLGNFIFDQYWSKPTQKAMTIEADFSSNPSDHTIRLVEHPIDLHRSQPSWE